MDHSYYLCGKTALDMGNYVYANEIFSNNLNDVLCVYGLYILNVMEKMKNDNIHSLLVERFHEIEELCLENDLEAIFTLAVCYERGVKEAKNLKKAENLYVKAYNMGHQRAGFNLATIYQNSQDINDVEKALKIYQELSILGNSEAMVNAGYILLFCRNLQNKNLAIKYFQSASKLGDSLAEYYLGLIYINKDFENENVDLALEYLNKSMIKGNLSAKELLADYYFSKETEKTKSFVMYKELAEENFISVYYRLGMCYELGIGVIKNAELANQYYKLSLQNGDKRAIIRLLNNED